MSDITTKLTGLRGRLVSDPFTIDPNAVGTVVVGLSSEGMRGLAIRDQTVLIDLDYSPDGGKLWASEAQSEEEKAACGMFPSGSSLTGEIPDLRDSAKIGTGDKQSFHTVIFNVSRRSVSSNGVFRVIASSNQALDATLVIAQFARGLVINVELPQIIVTR